MCLLIPLLRNLYFFFNPFIPRLVVCEVLKPLVLTALRLWLLRKSLLHSMWPLLHPRIPNLSLPAGWEMVYWRKRRVVIIFDIKTAHNHVGNGNVLFSYLSFPSHFHPFFHSLILSNFKFSTTIHSNHHDFFNLFSSPSHFSFISVYSHTNYPRWAVGFSSSSSSSSGSPHAIAWQE